MIAQLKGTVERKDADTAVIDVSGVGYLVHLARATLAQLPVGSHAALRIHTAVREDALELYGFAGELEETIFHELIRVPGIGPRMAMNILSGGTPEDIAAAVVQGDMARLKALPGVGKKTAERLVVDLRDRLAPFVAGARLPEGRARPAVTPPRDELLQALGALGYRPVEAERLAAEARSAAGEGASLDELVKAALRAR